MPSFDELLISLYATHEAKQKFSSPHCVLERIVSPVRWQALVSTASELLSIVSGFSTAAGTAAKGLSLPVRFTLFEM